MIDIFKKYRRGLVVAVALGVTVAAPVVADLSVTALSEPWVHTQRLPMNERLASFDFFVRVGEVPIFRGPS